MRLVPAKFLLVAVSAVCVLQATPDPAQAGLLGGVFGLLTSPLRMFGHGFHHGYRHRHEATYHSTSRHETVGSHERRESETNRNATSEPPAAGGTKEAPAASTDNQPITQARTEPVPEQTRRSVPRSATPMPLWPTASPSVFEDLVGYVLWPGDYADRLWSHGYGDIVNAVMTPASAPASGPDQAASLIANGMCSDQARTLADKPLTRMTDTLMLTDDQRGAFDELHAAVDRAIDRGRAAICGAPSATAADRSQQMIDGLWITWDAAIALRPPLQKFYDTLSDAQKAQLNGSASAGYGGAQACLGQTAAEAPSDRAGHTVGSAKPPAESPQMLQQQQFAETAKFLALSCPRGSEPTPVSRLSAVAHRMNALLYVVKNMHMQASYGSPGDGQKRESGAHSGAP